MSDRRYDQDEVDAIFRAAAEGTDTREPRAAHEGGLTLADLQAIGRDVGLSGDAIARAALAVDTRGAQSHRRLLGLPIGVTHSVTLGRRLTDDEWERIVVRLREVFQARGATRADGSLRQWTNGNLQVLLEPTEQGQRIRFATTHGAARTSIMLGLFALGTGAVLAMSTAMGGTIAHAGPALSFLGGAGLGMIAVGASRIPRWARERRAQMESLAAEIAARLPR